MTRINSGIRVKSLTDEHLLAEHREIKRIPSVYKKVCSGIPKKFCLGTGHVKFFVDKQKYLLERYKEIREELIIRGYKIDDYSTNWKDVSEDCFNDYVPKEDSKIIAERIIERINSSPKSYFRYYKQKISKSEAIIKLKEYFKDS